MNIPGFKILGQLGEGPLSTVWKAHQISLNRVVAIKVLKQTFVTKPGEVHPVLKEARAAAALKHPNIIPIFDAGEIDGTFYFVMEYIAGSTIGQLIEKKGVISQKSTLNAARQVVDALAHAWATAQIVHRGINPDNIMVSSDGTVKLADLGLAKLADPANLSARLKEGTVAGKLNYISPEQAKCSIRIDFRTDMYGLGATLYHMVCGQMPFKGLDPKEMLNQHLTGFLKNPRDISPSVSMGMAQFITKLMMKDYKARYADWGEVLTTINKTAAGKAKIVKPPEPAADGTEAPVSTVAAAVAPPPKKRSAFSSSLSFKEEPDPDAPPPLEIPWIVQVHVWALLLAWWVFLAWFQLRLPPLPDQPAPLPPRAAVQTPVSSTPPPSTPTQPRTPAPTQPPPSAAAPKPSVIAATAAEDAEKQTIAAFKNSVAGRVCAGDIDRALTMVDQELEYAQSKAFTADLKKLREILGEASTVLASALSKQVGQEAVITDRGQSRKVTIRGIAGTVVSADYTEAVGKGQVTKPVKFPVSKLDSASLVRGIDDDTPGKSLAKVALYMKSGGHEAARKSAANCGPLSDALTALAVPQPKGNGE